MGEVGSPGPAGKNTIVELLVLLFSHSAVKTIVGTDALRSVLGIRYQDMRRGNTLELEPLWEILCDQPGFDEAAGAPPLCKFKHLEDKLAIDVVLPVALADMSARDVERLAASLPVPSRDLRELLAPPPSPAGKGKDRRGRRTTKIETPWAKVGDERPRGKRPTGDGRARRRTSGPLGAEIDAALDEQTRERGHTRGQRFARLRALQVPLAVAGILGIGFASYRLYGFACAGPAFESFTADFGTIPIEDIERLGSQVGGVLTDQSWLDRPRAEREQALGDALRGLASQNVNAIYLMSPDRSVYATAKVGASGALEFEFTR